MIINYRQQIGASLIEIIMVVALMALITVAALTYYHSANEASKVSQAVSDITSLSSTIKVTFASKGNYSGLSEAMIRDMQPPSSGLKSRTPGHLKHPWSQAADAIEIPPPTDPFNSFRIIYRALPQAACQEISLRLIGRFETITATNGNEVTSTSEALSACDKTGSENVITVTHR